MQYHFVPHFSLLSIKTCFFMQIGTENKITIFAKSALSCISNWWFFPPNCCTHNRLKKFLCKWHLVAATFSPKKNLNGNATFSFLWHKCGNNGGKTYFLIVKKIYIVRKRCRYMHICKVNGKWNKTEWEKILNT